MTCDDIQESLSFYGDDGLIVEARARCDAHLEVCPVCREHLAELRIIRRGLATLNLSAAQTRNDRSSNDDMVVIADVFSNGTASVTDVVHSPRDRRLLDDFQEALRNNAAFVPASLDRRPETMRVIFSVQRVDVRESDY